MASGRTLLIAKSLLVAVILSGLACASDDDDAATVDADAQAAVDVATSVARGDGFLTGDPVRAEARKLTFGDAMAEAHEWGVSEAEIVGTPPPSHPVWLVRLVGTGVPPGPPSAGEQSATCLEILVVLDSEPIEDIMISGKPSDDC